MVSLIEREVLHEIAMAIGDSLDLDAMLRKALGVFLRRLGCTITCVVLADSSGRLLPAQTLPRSAMSNAALLEATQRARQAFAAEDAIRHPLHEAEDHQLFYGWRLGEQGMLLLGRFSPFSPEVLRELEPLLRKLTQALRACHQFSALQAAQREIQQREQQLKLIMDTAPIGIWLQDGEGKLTFVNRAFCQHMGLSADSVLAAAQYRDLIPAEFVPEYLASDEKALASADPIMVHERLPFADGKVHDLRVIKAVKRDAEGHPLSLVGLSLDITEELARAQELKLWALVFEHIHDGIVIADSARRVVAVNGAYLAMTGYTREELLGHTPPLFSRNATSPVGKTDLWEAIAASGHWRSEMQSHTKSGHAYYEALDLTVVRNEAGEITHFISAHSDITALKRSQETLERLAHHDNLTGLPNRTLLADRLEQAIARAGREATLVGVCFLDLDGFKPINDRLGHETGDRLLVEIGQRLKHTVRAGDSVARFGGDEFVVLLTDIRSLEEINATLERVLATCALPVSMAGQQCVVTTSIGVAVYPNDNADADTLLRHADQAMYRAKQAGRNRYQHFDPSEDIEAETRRKMGAELRQALARREFDLYYQPKVDMRVGEVIGAEALIRWRHPQQGLLAPGQFLHLLESDAELAFAVDEWIVHTALTQMQAWVGTGLHLPVSINIFPLHLQSAQFVAWLREVVAPFPKELLQMLQIEIVESAAFEELTQMHEILKAGAELGISFALDDFGTGYSSLSYLRHLPVSTVKIDQGFVRDLLDDPDDFAIVEGVLSLATAFGRDVLAEGVETVDHGILLMRLGCDKAQGFAIAHPMPADSIASWAASWRPPQAWASFTEPAWSREDYPLLLMGVEHRRWVGRLIDALELGPRPIPKVADPTACRFGQWLTKHGELRYGESAHFRRIRALHEQLHKLAGKIMALHLAGKTRDARGHIPRLVDLRDAIVRELTDLLDPLRRDG